MGIRLSVPPLSMGSRGALGEGWRANLFSAFWGVPSGPIGWVGARVLPVLSGRLYAVVRDELDLQPDDDLLDVGCGAGAFLGDNAAHLRFAAGVDSSPIQVGMARSRLAEAIAAGTAEIVLGDAAALPWQDGRFSAVASVNCLKFVPDPDQALREMHRVMRPGGRIVHMTDPPITDPDKSGKVDAYGIRQWTADDAGRMMEQAGFTEVDTRRLPAKQLGLLLVRGVKAE
jgi:SAM-dependent methyltransferase